MSVFFNRWKAIQQTIASQDDRKFFGGLTEPDPSWRKIVSMLTYVNVKYSQADRTLEVYGRLYHLWVELFLDITVRGLPANVKVYDRLLEMKDVSGTRWALREPHFKWIIAHGLNVAPLDRSGVRERNSGSMALEYLMAIRMRDNDMKVFDQLDEKYTFDQLIRATGKQARFDIDKELERDGFKSILANVRSLIYGADELQRPASEFVVGIPGAVASAPGKLLEDVSKGGEMLMEGITKHIDPVEAAMKTGEAVAGGIGTVGNKAVTGGARVGYAFADALSGGNLEYVRDGASGVLSTVSSATSKAANQLFIGSVVVGSLGLGTAILLKS